MDCTRFGNKLTYYRERNDMTEKDLARRLHVPVRSIEKWENSEAVPNDRMIARISDLFGVDFWNYLDMDEKHGGRHHLDADPDIDVEYSPLTVLKEIRAAGKQNAAGKKTAAGKQKTARTSSGGSSTGRKILSWLLFIVAIVWFFADEYILDRLFDRPDLAFLSIPVVVVLVTLSTLVDKKKR